MRRNWFIGFIAGIIFTTLLFFACSSILGISVKQLSNMIQIVNYIKVNSLEKITGQKIFEGAMRGMIGALNDPYSVYLDQEEYSILNDKTRGFGGIGIFLGQQKEELTVVEPMESTPAYLAGLQAGDVIVKIGDKITHGMNPDVASSLIRGEPGTKIMIEIYREESRKFLSYEITRELINIPSVRGKILEHEPEVAYIKISNFSNRTAYELADILGDLEKNHFQGIILDLRNNPGGVLQAAVDVADLFLPPGPIVYIVDKQNTKVIRTNSSALGKPLVVLINEGSASASEILAGAIKDREVGILVGTKTFGKGLVQTPFPLGDGTALKLTTGKYLTPNQLDINEKGIVPDVVVEMNRDNGEDNQLQKAIGILKRKM